MKTVGFCALHYGKDYLAYAIRSVIDAVDEMHFAYTPVGSHGHRSERACPESREELYEIARQASGGKFHWHEGTWGYEGQQRDSIHTYAPDADAIIVVDADELYPAEFNFRGYCEWGAKTDVNSRIRLPMVHAWRSFHRWVLHDPAMPERIIFPKSKQNSTGVLYPTRGDIYRGTKGAEYRYSDMPHVPLFHFGYAQRPEIVEYKQHTHGHKAEWRRDIDWFQDRFMANAQHDCHPVGSEYWNPEPVDPFALGLPEFMRSHPYAGMEVIE